MDLFDRVQPYARKAFVRVKPGLQRVSVPRHDFAEKRVSFLSGFPRSGTNMVIDVFEWSAKSEVIREGNAAANLAYRLRENAVVKAVVSASPARCVMVKALQDGDRLRGLMGEFPNSCAVWMYRHYDDCVNSILEHWPGHRNGIDEIVAGGADAAEWRGRNMTAETLARLRAQYRPDWNDATANAWFWVMRHQLFFDQGFDRDPEGMLVRYESLVVDPLRIIRPIADLVGVHLTQVMASVPHARSVRKRGAPDIAPDVRETCEEMLARLDATWQAQGL